MTTASAQQQTTAQAAAVQQDQLTIGQIVAILAAGLAAKKTLELLTRTLTVVGLPAYSVRVAYVVAGRTPRLPVSPATARTNAAGFRAPRGTALPLRRPGRSSITTVRSERNPALTTTLAGEDTYRAAYLYSAAQRVQRQVEQAVRSGTPQAQAVREAAVRERRFYAQHLQAQARRRTVAAQVDVAAGRHGVPFIDSATGTVTRLVGWHAVLDAKTSRECRLADGKNFPANRPPSIGWPGSVHPSCRCRAGAPFAAGRLLDSVITTRRAA